MTAAAIGQHLGADVAGEGTLWSGMAILTAQGDAAAGKNGSYRREQRRRRADEKLAPEPGTGRNRPLRELARQSRAIVAQAIHFPIACDKRGPYRHVAAPLPYHYDSLLRSHRAAGGSTGPDP
jgi:hypothetical protein